jgi:hypothetical protein
MTYAWTVYATMTTVFVALMALLGTALFQLLGRFDRLTERIDQRFEKVDQRFERIDQRFERIDQRFEVMELRRREDKAEVLDRLDVLAERITRLEAS